jgi:hypothetical protein
MSPIREVRTRLIYVSAPGMVAELTLGNTLEYPLIEVLSGAARAGDVKQPIEHLPHVHLAWPSAGLGGRNQTRYRLPLSVGQVRWVVGFHATASVVKTPPRFHRRAQIPDSL